MLNLALNDMTTPSFSVSQPDILARDLNHFIENEVMARTA